MSSKLLYNKKKAHGEGGEIPLLVANAAKSKAWQGYALPSLSA